MSQYSIEDKLDKIAAEVTAHFLSEGKGGKTLNDLVKKAADDNMLNEYEVETLTGKVNHAVYKPLFNQDKLAMFDIAKFETILKMDRNMNITEYKVAYTDGKDMQKAAQAEDDDDPAYITAENIGRAKINPVQAALLMENGEDNMRELYDAKNEREKEISTIRNRVIALLKNGETLDNIYAVIRDTWGDGNKEEAKAFFDNLVENLKVDGYVKSDEYGDSAVAEDVDDGEPLKQASMNLLEQSERLIKREIIHDVIVTKLASEGYGMMAEKLDGKIPDNYYGASCAVYKYAAFWDSIASGMRYVGDQFRPAQGSAPCMPKKGPTHIPAVRSMAAMATAALVLGAAVKGMDLTTKGIDAIRKNMWREKLKKRYPELNSIPEQMYNDIYDSIVGLEPTILKAPYALKEMIMAHNQYGTIDANTTLKLLESGRKSHPNMPLIAKSMMAGIAGPQITVTD